MAKEPLHGDEQRMLAAIIAEALYIADTLELSMVGISLSGALERLTGHGLAPEPLGVCPSNPLDGGSEK